MEQNELAMIAESNNKAILLFTVVTIIFLPLSFFTVSHTFGLHPSGSSAGQGCGEYLKEIYVPEHAI